LRDERPKLGELNFFQEAPIDRENSNLSEALIQTVRVIDLNAGPVDVGNLRDFGDPERAEFGTLDWDGL